MRNLRWRVGGSGKFIEGEIWNLSKEMMIKVLGLDSISKNMSIVKNKMNLAERRIAMKV